MVFFIKNANLYKADLRGVKGLMIEQIKEVKTINKAKIDPELLEKIKAELPGMIAE